MHFLREIFRSLPFMIGIIEFINGIANNDKETLFFSFGLLTNMMVINPLLKYISIIIVGLNPITNRPQGARNCHNFNDNSKNNFAQLTGMPSGHSQSMGFWAGYKLKKIVMNDSDFWKNRKVSIISIIVVSCLTAVARMSGSYVGTISAYSPTGCHTPLQVLIGYFIGILLGWYYYDLVQYFLKNDFRGNKKL